MRSCSFKPWNVKKNEDYLPGVTVIVPFYNEEKTVKLKLENLTRVLYPRDRLQIILVNDGSSDGTMHEILDFKKSTPDINLQILDNAQRKGKTKSINAALSHAKGEIVIVSDADCFWPPDILRKALPFLSDTSIGAVTGLEVLLNPQDSWVTETEILYDNTVHSIRLGESKVHSTIFFQGGFGAYRRNLLEGFDLEADDSGTALNIVQKGARALLLSDAVYFTTFPRLWREKIAIKIRRASQLVRIWLKSLKLSLKGKLLLPWKIFIPEAYLYLVNPFIFVAVFMLSILVVVENPIYLIVFLTLLIAVSLTRKLRTLAVETIQNQLILLMAIFLSVSKRNFISWRPVETSRTQLNRELLKEKGLI
jgi:cellulose synthase/poly-beta-1,6-N-acetylglucosamine synthase-like glycosyltransferase